jgi:NitT/TauT family transport system ATP-binding protein
MGFVFQDTGLLPWRNVQRNVEIGLEARGVAKDVRAKKARESLELVGLADVATSAPYYLSGGMQQRVGVARALAVEPRVLLMDEPFGQVDSLTRERLQVETAQLWSRLGTSIVFVTHDVDEAIFFSDRIAIFAATGGVLAEVVSVECPKRRWTYNVRADSRAIELREHILKTIGVGAAAQP